MLDGESYILLDVMRLVFLDPCYQMRSNFTDNYWGGDYPAQTGPDRLYTPLGNCTGVLIRP
jgi:hypothetical protein